MMKKLYIILVLFLTSKFYCQNNYTINKIIKNLNNEIFSFKIDKNAKYFKSEIHNLIDDSIFQDDNFYFIKLLTNEEIDVYYIFDKVDLDSYSLNLTESNPFKLMIYSKSINYYIVLSFMGTSFISKISDDEFKIKFATNYDLIFSNKLILNSSLEITHLVKINWIERDLPIDLKPMTSFEIQNYTCHKKSNIVDLEYNYLDLKIKDLFLEILKIDEVNSKLIFKVEESIFDFQEY